MRNLQPTIGAHNRPADMALRCAWLREHGWRTLAIDLSGQLSAQLWDFGGLLEVAQREGWWDR